MAGEKSKKSGEIGEELARKLLDRIGWKGLIHNISIDCNTPSHQTKTGAQRQSHGEDQVHLYNNPFHDDRTDIVHVSNKNISGSYPGVATLRRDFKSHIKELSETIECAKHNKILADVAKSFKSKRKRYHAGLLIWLHNDHENIEKSILSDLAGSRLDVDGDVPYYVIDNGRATFLLKVVDDLKRRAKDINGQYSFFYPSVGTSMTVNEMRTGRQIPLELIASDIIPAVLQVGDRKELIVYANEEFEADAYKNLMAYGLKFATGLVSVIRIGMPNYNSAHDKEEVELARKTFHDREEVITPFSFNRTILNLLSEDGS